MKYTGAFEQGREFKNFGIDYLKGVLYTYARLNQPDSNLAYDYGIIEIEKTKKELTAAVKEQIELFNGQSFTISFIERNQFEKSVTSWLFEEKFVSPYRIECEIAFVVALIEEVTGFREIYRIENFNPDGYDFGVYFEHYILESENKLYLLYFNYTD